MSWLAKRLQNKLARKVVVLMVLAGAVLSLLASGVQIYLSYQHDYAELVNEIDIVDQGFRSGFENAISDSNFQQIEVLLNGVMANASIEHLLLVAPSGQYWIRGTLDADNMVVKSFALTNIENAPKDKFGQFTIGVTLDGVDDRAWSQFVTILFSNLVKATIASLVMLGLFNRYVSYHLRTIASYVKENSWMSLENSLSLNRENTGSPDDLDAIVNALNEAKTDYMASYNQLEEEICMRRKTEKRIERQALALKRSSLQLERANQEQAEFTYAISHDLKSPTNTIGMINNELIEMYAEQLGDDGRELLDMSQKTIARMGEMIEYILHYSTAVNREMLSESIELNSLLEDIQQDLQDDIKKSAAVITVGELPTMIGDATQLRLLFQNVISNSIKFCKPGQTPVVDIQHCSDSEPDEIKIAVRDNGIGIEPKDRVSVFSLFNKLHTHDVYPGSGIGLALCQRIASNHNGSIVFRDHASNDTVVDITLAA